jgi:hypothetical protein
MGDANVPGSIHAEPGKRNEIEFPITERDMMTKRMPAAMVIGVFVAVAAVPALMAQGRGATSETWWVNKTKGGVYTPPMRPLWKQSELKQIHAGQNNWQEAIIKDPEQDATYNSAAPGTHFTARRILTRQASSSSLPATCVSPLKDRNR